MSAAAPQQPVSPPAGPPQGPPAADAGSTPRCPTCKRWLKVPRPPERRAAAAHGGKRKKGQKVRLHDKTEERLDCIHHVGLTVTEEEDIERLMEMRGYTSKRALLRWLIRKGLYNL